VWNAYITAENENFFFCLTITGTCLLPNIHTSTYCSGGTRDGEENWAVRRTSARSAGLAPFHRTPSVSYSGLVLLPVSRGIKLLSNLVCLFFYVTYTHRIYRRTHSFGFIHGFHIVLALPSAAEYYQVLRCADFCLDPVCLVRLPSSASLYDIYLIQTTSAANNLHVCISFVREVALHGHEGEGPELTDVRFCR
jgi:hypothetical protein